MGGRISVGNVSSPTFAQPVDIPHLRFNANYIQNTSIWSFVAPNSLAQNGYVIGNYKVRYGFASEPVSS